VRFDASELRRHRELREEALRKKPAPNRDEVAPADSRGFRRAALQ
jgi:hypothetical protein